jgi:hypothetical protein
MRLRGIAVDNNKVGRIVPSVLVLATQEYVLSQQQSNGWHNVSEILTTATTQHHELYACAGEAAIWLSDEQGTDNYEYEIQHGATIRNVKRTLLVAAESEEEDLLLSLTVTPLGRGEAIRVDATVLAVGTTAVPTR